MGKHNNISRCLTPCMLLCTTHSAVFSPPCLGYAVILSTEGNRQKLYHKQYVPALFKKKNDRDWGGRGVKRTQRVGVVSEELVELVVKDVKQGRGKESGIYKWKHERPLYLELLKIEQKMVAGASWPDTPLSFQAGGINRQGAV